MKNWIYFTFWFILLILTEATSLYCVKYWSIHQSQIIYLGLSLILYMGTAWCLSRMLMIYSEIAVVNILWNIISTLYGLAIGILIFQEHVSNLQLLGSILGIISIILILNDDNK